MSKDCFYFSHDYHARHDPKLEALFLDHGLEGIGAYWCIIEMLYEQGCSMPTHYERISKALHSEVELIRSVLNDYDLFQVTDNSFTSYSVQRRFQERLEKSEKARESANKRWNPSPVMPTQCEGSAIKESKGK